MYYFDVLEALYKGKIRYLIVGGLAVNLHNVPRMTNDIDIIIATDKDNILALCRLMKDLGYVPRLPVNPELMADPDTLRSWIQEKNLKAFTFYHKTECHKVVDVLLDQPLDFASAEKRCVVKRGNNFDIPVVSIDDLIIMKKASGRSQDTADIALLQKVKQLTGI